jgi:tRNA-2-methylthio-N6-dimethylallyladenosine synthase
MNVQLSLEETYADVVPLRPEGTNAAFLSIMRGCNNMCAFCIVPFTRGRERSRPMASILDEVRLQCPRGMCSWHADAWKP